MEGANELHDNVVGMDNFENKTNKQKTGLKNEPLFSPLVDALKASLMLGVTLSSVAMVIRSAKDNSKRSCKQANKETDIKLLLVTTKTFVKITPTLFPGSLFSSASLRTKEAERRDPGNKVGVQRAMNLL